VRQFTERFEEGAYRVTGRAQSGEYVSIEGELTHDLPAAPRVAIEVDGDDVTIRWEPGNDLGRCAVPSGIPNPGTVAVVRWEVAVEPNEDALPGGELPDGVPFGKLTMQFLGDERSVLVPASFIAPYRAAGVNEFKGEVGAREEGGNQTFTEIEFTTE
jgi:hypothetical protein